MLLPTCDVLSSPDGCWGESITNMNKVPCRLFLTNGGGDILYDSGCYEEKKTGAVIYFVETIVSMMIKTGS